MRPIHLIPGLMLTVCLCSCVGTAVKTVVKKTELKYSAPRPGLYADTTFRGLRTFIRDTHGDVNVLMTHGLTDKSEDHFDLLTAHLATRLHLRMLSGRKTLDSGGVTNNDASRRLGFESWKLFEWKFRSDSLNKQVSFYFVYWAPVTKPAKDFIHRFNRTEYRTRLSSLAKDSLFINIFGDLALYLNTDYKLQLQSAFAESLENIQGPTVVIGGGFGVQVMFEAITYELEKAVLAKRLEQKQRPDTSMMQQRNLGINIQDAFRKEGMTAYQFKFDIQKVFLLTNQIPFVSLLRMQPDSLPTAEVHNKEVYSAFTNYCNLTKRKLELISFYDPNDAFGYKLPPITDELFSVVNVRVNIAENWTINPRRTTNFVLPQLKGQKATDLFLNVIDQKQLTQELMLSLKSPADLTRSDYRVMGTLVDGSDYKLVAIPRELPRLLARDMDVYAREKLVQFKGLVAALIALNVKTKVDPKTSVLPFSLPSEFRDSDPKTIGSGRFEGVDLSIGNNDITQVLTVHGVKNQEPDSFDDLVNSVAKSLGFYSRPTDFKVICARGENCPQMGPLEKSYRPGTVKVTTFTGVQGQKLIVYAVYWSSITKYAKEWLDSVSIDRESSVVPRMVKQNLINDGFADIELSFGKMKDKVELTLEAAFRAMQSDYEGMKSKGKLSTYYLTGSLGSKLLLDFLNSRHPKDTLILNVQSRARTWYMLTNQLIMTALRDISFDRTTRNITYEDFYKTSYGHVADLLNKSKFDIVAFNDPNDLLSFIVPDDVMGITDDPNKIHNTYLNLAQGVRMNMDQLIRVAGKVDRKLKTIHRRAYKKEYKYFPDSINYKYNFTLTKSDQAYKDLDYMLTMAKKRFELRGNAPDTTKDLNPKIDTLLRRRVRDDNKLYDHLNEKRKYYAYNLYLTDEQQKVYRASYDDTRKYNGKCRVIRKKSFRKLCEPGLIMPFLRSVSNFMHYQDFVSDFGRAHVGAKESSRIVKMIAHGFDPDSSIPSVTSTRIDQKLYDEIHNANQKSRKPRPCLKCRPKKNRM